MANLSRPTKQALTVRPKMQHFKMGLLSKHRDTKRLESANDQLVIGPNGIPYLTCVDHIYAHSDGTFTGNCVYQTQKVKVKGEFIYSKPKTRKTITGEVVSSEKRSQLIWHVYNFNT